MRFSRIGKNAKLGDGSLIKQWSNASTMFMSTDLSLLEHKKMLCEREGITTTKFGTQKSGYGGTKTIYNFSSHVNEKLTEVYDADILEVLNDLDKEDLYLWYFDDGSWHKTRNTMHLYSNALDETESNVLMDVIEGHYGIRPRLRTDRKKDGRSFYYLYFPRKLVQVFRPEVKNYLETNGLDTMYYKVGGKDYEDIGEYYLDDETVRKIRSMYEGKHGDVKRISLELGVGYDKVKGVTQGRTYKDVI